MDWLIENVGSLIDVALKLVGAFAVVATLTPNESDNAVADGSSTCLAATSGTPRTHSVDR